MKVQNNNTFIIFLKNMLGLYNSLEFCEFFKQTSKKFVIWNTQILKLIKEYKDPILKLH